MQRSISASILRIASITCLGAMALPAILSGSWAQAALILSFAAAALIGAMRDGIAARLQMAEASLMVAMAASAVATLVPLVWLFAAPGSGVGGPFLAYLASLTLIAISVSFVVRIRAEQFLSASPFSQPAKLPFWLRPLLVVALMVALVAVWSSIQTMANSGAPYGRGIVIFFCTTFATCFASAYLTAFRMKRLSGGGRRPSPKR